MSSAVTPPLGLIRPSRSSIKYRIVIEQQPLQARSCGFGEKDRRTIDPPVILRLCVEDENEQLHKVRTMDDRFMFVAQCNLYTQDGKTMRHLVYHPSHKEITNTKESGAAFQNVLSFEKPMPMRNFLGALVSNAYQLTDANGKPGVFFIFQDLSVRTEGRFRLKFILMDLSAGLHTSGPLTMSTWVLDQVFSEPFTVYSPKEFPGMTESSALSKVFAMQGIKLSIRNDKRTKRLNDGLYTSSSAEEQKNARGNDEEVEHHFATAGGKQY